MKPLNLYQRTGKLIIRTCLLLVAFGSFGNAAEEINVPPGQTLSLDRGWRFYQGDIPFPVITGHDSSYNNAKAGRTWGAAAPDYDDSAWRRLDLPHDWVVEGPFDPKANLSQGYRPRGIAWYRRQFTVPPSDRGLHHELRFDGIATHATIWVNGTLVHRNWCGYTSSYVDITPLLLYGKSVNSIAVRVDADAMEGWWYEGGGIYRHTWLVKRQPVHLITDGVFANPVRIAEGKWTIPIEATVYNSGKDDASVEVESTLMDPEGHVLVSGKSSVKVEVLAQQVAKYALEVTSPRLWSVDDPTLYRVKTVIRQNGSVLDEVETPAGFRTIHFDAEKGFTLNDQPLKLKGVCNHQDHAGVGVAVPDSIWDLRIRQLKSMGVNAYRCAHNPPAKEFLEACDRLGLLVMDENRNFNTSPEYLRQLEWMVRRDRNHPSIILWSVFNEEPVQGSEVGYEMVRRMSAFVKSMDKTRPVTAAMNGGLFTSLNVSKAVDVVGFNYQADSYDRFHEENPGLPLTSSEDTSAFMTRGEYKTDSSKKVIDSYDENRAQWGATHRDGWKAVAERPYLAGGFVWTGHDYRGEPTPNAWPAVSSYFGAMDLCGFPKAAYYIHQAQWLNRPVLQLVPHWNWAGEEGKPIKVMALTNAETVALSLNGKLIEEKPVDPYMMVSWEVPYAPGQLEAIGKKGGREVSRFTVRTTGKPVSLRITPERMTLNGDGQDALAVTVEALDAGGLPVPTANPMVAFECSGAGSIIGHGNGDPTCHDPEKGNSRRLFNGLAQVILQSNYESSGTLVLKAKAEGLVEASTEIKVEKVAPIPFVPVMADTVFNVEKWRVSPISSSRPDPNQSVADNDMNSWAPVQTGKLQAFESAGWAIYRVRFLPPAKVRLSGGVLKFESITGNAEVWMDGKLLGAKSSPEAAAFEIPVPPGDAERMVNVLIECPSSGSAGLGGEVSIKK